MSLHTWKYTAACIFYEEGLSQGDPLVDFLVYWNEMVIQGQDRWSITVHTMKYKTKQVDAGVQATSMQTRMRSRPAFDTFSNLYLAKMKNDLKYLHRVACADEVV